MRSTTYGNAKSLILGFIGKPMERMWAPWRIAYIKDAAKRKKCIFCYMPKQRDDAKNFILYRGEFNFVMLNGYPYSPGHIMITPYRHVDSFAKLLESERYENVDLVTGFMPVLEKAVAAEGFNIGANQGRIAGAGFDKHVHMHVVPRWKGDVNFMVPVADTKVLPESLSETFKRIKKAMGLCSFSERKVRRMK